MLKKGFSLLICLIILTASSLAVAGGPPQYSSPRPCAPPPAPGYTQGGNPCAYWGDAPFPGMCGGIIALPFLVVGSILGGNTMGPCAAPQANRFNCGPRPYPPAGPGHHVPPRYGYGAPASPAPLAGGILEGFAPLELATGLLGNVYGGPGVL
jgi:hypothetical protein